MKILFAVASWHNSLYHPLVSLIRQRDVLKEFPGRTEADLYVWVMDHLYFLREQYGDEVEAEEAALDFAEQFSQRPGRRSRRTIKDLLTPWQRKGEG